ncbi:MAG: LysE family transporter [Deltaproteobacteria bacterium]|nr:LysE family transporter [Deltaproteobacteria bacterium]
MAPLAAALVTGIVLGFVTSIPLGPVAGMVVQLAVRHDRQAAYLCGLGCAAVDGAFSLAAALGVSRLLESWPPAVPAMYALGGLVLTGFGWLTLRERPSAAHPSSPDRPPPPRRRAFFTGVALSATNPVPLLAWVGLSGTVMATLPRQGIALFSAGVVGGVLAWFSLVTELTLRGKLLLGRHHRVVPRIVGVLLLASAAVCFWRAIVTFLG